MNKKTSPFNLKRFSQRQEGVPVAWQKDKPDPYGKRSPGDGYGYDRVRASDQDDMSSPSFGQNNRNSPIGSNSTDVSEKQEENLGELPDSKQNTSSPFREDENASNSGIGSQQGDYGKGLDTDYGLMQHGDDVGSNSTNSNFGAGSENPLGISATVGRMVDGTEDWKSPFSNMHKNREVSLMGRRENPSIAPIYNNVKRKTAESFFRFIKNKTQ